MQSFDGCLQKAVRPNRKLAVSRMESCHANRARRALIVSMLMLYHGRLKVDMAFDSVICLTQASIAHQLVFWCMAGWTGGALGSSSTSCCTGSRPSVARSVMRPSTISSSARSPSPTSPRSPSSARCFPTAQKAFAPPAILNCHMLIAPPSWAA